MKRSRSISGVLLGSAVMVLVASTVMVFGSRGSRAGAAMRGALGINSVIICWQHYQAEFALGRGEVTPVTSEEERSRAAQVGDSIFTCTLTPSRRSRGLWATTFSRWSGDLKVYCLEPGWNAPGALVPTAPDFDRLRAAFLDHLGARPGMSPEIIDLAAAMETAPAPSDGRLIANGSRMVHWGGCAVNAASLGALGVVLTGLVRSPRVRRRRGALP